MLRINRAIATNKMNLARKGALLCQAYASGQYSSGRNSTVTNGIERENIAIVTGKIISPKERKKAPVKPPNQVRLKS